jgi:hypothetical protein
MSDAADRVQAAIHATAKQGGRESPLDAVMRDMDPDERDAWVEVLSDLSINPRHVHRALREAGYDVGTTWSCVATWRTKHGLT